MEWPFRVRKGSHMKLSTKSRYSLRAMLHLALHQGAGAVMMAREIAECQNLPETYLEQLMLALRKAGLVSAIRGAHGGYMLARKPEDITLAQIVAALEGTLSIADCCEVPNCCINPVTCALKDVFGEVNGKLYAAFDGITLADLARRQQSKELAEAPMYYI